MAMPLEGIRVLDLTRLFPGPYCTMMLADFGADVIKVEDKKLGDYTRWGEPKVGEYSAMFNSLNRNKRSITLDLKSEEDKEVFIDLVKTADVLVESFRPGVMDRLGLGYEKLKKINSKLVYCAITGYGQSGPYANLPGHDTNYLAYAGLLGLQGEYNGRPINSAVQIADVGGGGLMATIGVLIAIIEAQKSGKGQFVDISMTDGAVSWLQTVLPEYLVSGKLPEKGKLGLSGGRACYENYETKDGRYLSVGAIEEKFWVNFCKVIGKEELIQDLEAPFERQLEMKKEIEGVIKTKTLSEWMQLFKGVDTCIAPILTLEEMLEDPQIKHRQLIEEVYHPDHGLTKQIANPIKLSRTKAKTYRPAPKYGEHNEEIFKELGHLVKPGE